jgi:hypothetical protein
LHAVCTDFDPPDATLQGPLDGVTNIGGATGALDTTHFASSPRAAKFDFVAMGPDSGSSASAGYNLYWNSKTSGTELTAEAKVFLPARPSIGYYEIIDIAFQGGSELDLQMSPSGESFVMHCYPPCTPPAADAGLTLSQSLGLSLSTNKWVDVVVHATIGGSTLSYSVMYDGIVAGSGTNIPYAYPTAYGKFYVGAVFETPTAVPFSIWFDDVTFDQK